MSRLIWAGIAALAVLLLMSVVLLVVRRRRCRAQLSNDTIQIRWRGMQKLCASKDTWQRAVIEADMLLEEVLKKKGLRGKTEGERLTSAQRELTDNEGVWFGHKLRLKVESAPETKLKEREVKQALVGIRQALKDLGVFPDDK